MRRRRLLVAAGTLALAFTTVPAASQEQQTEWRKFDPALHRTLHQEGYGRPYEHITGAAVPERDPQERQEFFNVSIFADNETLSLLGLHYNSRHARFATARVTAADILRLSAHPGVRTIKMGTDMTLLLDHSLPSIQGNRVHAGEIFGIPYTGKGAIIGIIDTGIDIFHMDFRDPADPNRSRVISIWDLELEPEGNEQPPASFDYGVEYTRGQIESDLRGDTEGLVRALDVNGHGTHVAGIAGGNGAQANGTYVGVAPDAEFIVAAFPGGRFATARIVDALQYIFSKAEELGRPAVVNMSIGGHGGSHDGTSVAELAISEHAVLPGRAVVVAAGNSGTRNHHQGEEVAPSRRSLFDITVPEFTPTEGDDNDFFLQFLWYEFEGDPDITVEVESPSGHAASAGVNDSIYVETADGAVLLMDFGHAVHDNVRLMYLEVFDADEDLPPRHGRWNVRFFNNGTGTATFNAWLVTSSMGNVTLRPNTGRRHTVTMPGTAEYGITVGSYVTRNTWTDINNVTRTLASAEIQRLSTFSGGGPTRDGRLKPDVTAPGEVIASSLSRSSSSRSSERMRDPGYVISRGTSMASPHVAGVVALMFEANPHLSGAEIQEMLRKTSYEDRFTDNVPGQDWGYGKVNSVTAFNLFDMLEGVPDRFVALQNYPNPFNAATLIRFALPEAAEGRLVVYDILGREVAVLAEGAFSPRVYTVAFEAGNLSSGVYMFRLETDRFSGVQKMLLLR
jgi:minor extracellular serine protease Vpr